jgi:tartrate dehydratase beta subunit/fumarate hydratase class I family protein
MSKLTTPIAEASIRSLKVCDEVRITGTLFAGRDAGV